MSNDKSNTKKSANTNAEEQKDLASKPVVDAKAIYGEPPTAEPEESAPEKEEA